LKDKAMITIKPSHVTEIIIKDSMCSSIEPMYCLVYKRKEEKKIKNEPNDPQAKPSRLSRFA